MVQASSSRTSTRVRFSSQDVLPSDPDGQWLCQTFNYPWSFLQADSVSSTDKPDWITVNKYPLRPRVLWAKWQDADQLIGVRFGKTTHYALLDIDTKSRYRTPAAIAQLRIALETIGICRIVIVRSSWSLGLHIYLPLPEAVNTFSLACTLKHSLEAHGFEVKAGQLEILPNVKAWGNHHKGEFTHYQGHRLPLQPGSGSLLLDDDLNPQPYGNALVQLRYQWEQAANGQDLDLLHSALSKGRQHQSKRKRNRQSLRRNLQDWRNDLESEISEGWTGPSQTNTLLKSIGCYGVVFEGLSGDDLADYIEQIATSRPGYQQWCRHQHEIRVRARAWARATENYYWPPGHNPRRTIDLHRLDGQNNIINFNDERAQDAHRRIQAAVATLIEHNQLPDSTTARAVVIAKQANTSRQTLYKLNNLPLWHPEHRPDNTVPPEEEAEPVDSTRRCERPETISNSATSDPSNSATSEMLKQPNIKELHTIGGNMKCMKPLAEDPPVKNYFDPELGGVPRGGGLRFPQVPQLWDLSDEIAQIQACFVLLRWSVAQATTWIAERYEGRQLSQLYDLELIQLLQQLQELCL